MSKATLLTCVVALKGDRNNEFNFSETRPVTWPEVEVLMTIHGDDAVRNIEAFREIEAPSRQGEFERLALRYGQDICKRLFVGRPPAMEFNAPKHIPRVGELARKKPGPKPKTADENEPSGGPETPADAPAEH